MLPHPAQYTRMHVISKSRKLPMKPNEKRLTEKADDIAPSENKTTDFFQMKNEY
jgi:hypothetical protein